MPESGGGELRLVVFRLGEESFALPLEAVVEAARGGDLRRREAEGSTAGWELRVRGDALPVLDLRTRLGMEPRDRPEEGRVLVSAVPGRERLGLLVDGVEGVRSVPLAALAPVPRFFRRASACVRGVVQEGEGLIVVLDPAGIRPGGGAG